MKTLFILLTVFIYAKAEGKVLGSEGVGGGDLCENRIKIVRDDLKNWIISGGSNGLKFPVGVTVADYNSQMLSQIEESVVRCVSEGDQGFPVQINNIPKVCRFERLKDKSFITCDYKKFQMVAQSDQYVLIHHEYAGLAEIETPKGSDSNYVISNQISGYLVNQVVKKLSIVPSKERDFSIEREFRIDKDSPFYNGYAIAVGIPGQLVDFDKFDKASQEYHLSINDQFKNYLVDVQKNKIVAVVDLFTNFYRHEKFIISKYDLSSLLIRNLPAEFEPIILITDIKDKAEIAKIFLINKSSQKNITTVLDTQLINIEIAKQVEAKLSKENRRIYKFGNQVSLKIDNSLPDVGDPSFVRIHTIHSDSKSTDLTLYLTTTILFTYENNKIIPRVYSVKESTN